MAERAKPQNGDGANKDELAEFMGRLDEFDQKIVEVKAECGGRISRLKDGQKRVFEEAKKAGYPTNVLKGIRSAREHERLAKLQREKLEDLDHQSQYDMFREMLGDMSPGQNVVALPTKQKPQAASTATH